MRLENRVALVTGAAHPKGIGRAIAEGLAAEGATVIASDLPSAEGFADAPAHLNMTPCDVTNADAVQAFVSSVCSAHDALHIVVNNAGVARGGTDFAALTDADWMQSVAVNLLGTVNVCRAVVPVLERGASVINIASMAGLGAIEGIPACYTASKFAVVGLTKQLALEYAESGVRFNAVCPGSIRTQLHEQTLALIAQAQNVSLAEAQRIEDASVPMGYTAEPQVVADAVAFLASDAASYVTGTALPVAGGMPPGL